MSFRKNGRNGSGSGSPPDSAGHAFVGSLFDAWRLRYDDGIPVPADEVAAAADHVLARWTIDEDRQIPLDVSDPDVALGVLLTQRAKEDAQAAVDVLKPSEAVAYRALASAMADHAVSIEDRIRSGSHVLVVARVPNSHWNDAVFVALAAWIGLREAPIRRLVSSVDHVQAEKRIRDKSKQLDVYGILHSVGDRHVVVTVVGDDTPGAILAVADAVVDVIIGQEDLKGVVADRFGGQPEWPSHLIAAEFRPSYLDLAFIRARAADDVPALLEALDHADAVDEAVKAAAKVGEAADEIKEKRKEAGVTRPVAPLLADLSGYGAARAWGESLAEDLAAYRNREIDWSDVDAGCLLHGPPGTGKTMFASALAATCGVPFIATSYAEWQASKDGHAGDVVKAIKSTFAAANGNAPCIVFIDEIDAIPSRSGGNQRYSDWWGMIVTALLECLDGTKRREGVVVIAACNHPDRLDPALVRSGRLDRRFEVALPDEEALVGILAHHLPGIDASVLEPVATTLAGMTSGADAARIAREARRIARRAKRDLAAEDLLAVAMPEDTRPAPMRRRLAVHEAGHAVALMALGQIPASLSLVAMAGSQGRVVEDGAASDVSVLRDVEAAVVVSLAGRAAEEVVLGQPSIGAGGGAGSDLERATQLLATSQSVFGLGGYLVHGLNADGAMIEERLRRLYAETLLLIGRHRLVVEALADLAIEKRVLGKKALAAFAVEVGLGGGR